MSQANGGEEWHDKEKTPGIGNSMCKDLEERERLLPESTSKSIFLRKLYIWGKEGVVESHEAT